MKTNYFLQKLLSSLKIVEFLRKKRIHALATYRPDRIRSHQFRDEKMYQTWVTAEKYYHQKKETLRQLDGWTSIAALALIKIKKIVIKMCYTE